MLDLVPPPIIRHSHQFLSAFPTAQLRVFPENFASSKRIYQVPGSTSTSAASRSRTRFRVVWGVVRAPAHLPRTK